MTTIFRLPESLRHAIFNFTLSSVRKCSQNSRRFSITSPTFTPAFTTGRSYADAIALLDSLQSNRAIVSSISSSTQDMNLRAIPEMLNWTRRAGYDVSDFAKRGLKCIHVAGTKGKGSVCVMVENILLQYQKADAGTLGRVGLYTSPHLVTVRERIRIDGAPISESMFTRYFFELWDLFSRASISQSSDINPSPEDVWPGYFRYLTLLALHTFMQEGVQNAVVECGIGGEYDSTNILPPEAVSVSAITKLGIDHVSMLGTTIESIAWHKAGIMKKGITTYTVEQITGAQSILEKRAAEIGSKMMVVRRLPALGIADFKLGLGGDFQKENASLAVAVASSHLRNMGLSVPLTSDLLTSFEKLPLQFLKGLETVSWPGRWQVKKEGNIEWLIDGAHTTDSIEATALWYLEKLGDALNEEVTPTSTMLIFNQQDRDAKILMQSFLKVLFTQSSNIKVSSRRLQSMQFSAQHKFTFAAFCTNIPFRDQVPKDLDIRPQQDTAKVYERLTSNNLHMCFGSVEEAVHLARRVSQGDERVLVLVTGSLHLVGGLLKVLERDSTPPTDAKSPPASNPDHAISELKHALDEEALGQFSPQGTENQAAEPVTSKPSESSLNERERAREEIFETFLSSISPESQANIMGEGLIEPPAPASSRNVHYFHARPQPWHNLHSTGQETNKALHQGKLKRVTRPSKDFIEAFFSDTKGQSQDGSVSVDSSETPSTANDSGRKRSQ